MYPVILITLIIQGCNMGSRMLATLFAIEVGVNPFLVGLDRGASNARRW